MNGFLKRNKADELEQVKKQKMGLQNSIESLRAYQAQKTLKAKANQDLDSLTKAASFFFLTLLVVYMLFSCNSA